MSIDDRKESCRTYIEQTKLLVTLASTFVVAPAALVAFARPDKGLPPLTGNDLKWIASGEAAFVFSILCGYVVLASIAGSQDQGKYDVYRTATVVSSLLQLIAYLGGIAILAIALTTIISASAHQ